MNTEALQVLLVEDDRDLAASVADYLALDGISVDHAYNGQAGLTLACFAREGGFDLWSGPERIAGGADVA